MAAARHMASTLTARGVQHVTHVHGSAVSLVTVPMAAHGELNVWLDPSHIAFANRDGTYTRCPAIDLYDVTELLIRRHEE